MELRQEKQVYEMPHRLTYYECDDTGHPTLSMILSMLTMVSDVHSTFLGLDAETIHQTGGAWVITQYEGELSTDQPTYGQTVILGTRAVAYNRFFALREFWITDPDHHYRYVHLQATFVFMNLTKRRLMSIPPQLITVFNSPQNNRPPRLKRPTELTTDQGDSRQYHVRYFDIDINHHVNNARYSDWLLDPLGSDFLRTHHLQGVNIKYFHEVKENSLVISRYQLQNEKGQLKSLHEIDVAGQKCVSAELTWITSK